ncbi:MAG: peptidoglycan bridge formation glycyltransferase FemA/FemB family protein [Anaerolineae bacterium]|nr:peptidoglycan bridge formation glycyltransferase FemA/FemB family protein [Anaerolineae bacterium]
MAITVDIQAPAPWLDEEWNRFVERHRHGHLLQSCQWAQFKSHHAWSACRVVARQDSDLVAGAQVLFRRVGPVSVAYVPKGPVVDWDNPTLVGAVVDGLHAICRRRGAIFLRVEPDLPHNPDLAQRLVALKFHFAGKVQPLSTLHLDIDRDPDEILAGMKPKTRYNIRLAERKGVQVREGSEADVSVFYRLSQITSLRDDFPIHAEAYYRDAYRIFVPSDMARLLLAEYNGEVIAGLMVFAFGATAWYMYGASSNRYRNLMPNHLLQWRAIQWARARGCKVYDFWGIPDEIGQNPDLAALASQRSDGLWGVYRFKEGFGGRVVRYMGAYDFAYVPLVYAAGTTLWPRLRHFLYRLRRQRLPESEVSVE